MGDNIWVEWYNACLPPGTLDVRGCKRCGMHCTIDSKEVVLANFLKMSLCPLSACLTPVHLQNSKYTNIKGLVYMCTMCRRAHKDDGVFNCIVTEISSRSPFTVSFTILAPCGPNTLWTVPSEGMKPLSSMLYIFSTRMTLPPENFPAKTS